MEMDFINLSTENLEQEHLCCIIRSRKPHPGVEAKRQWLSNRLQQLTVWHLKICEKEMM